MDAKKVGLYVIFGMAIAYLISAIGWSGSRISQCNEEFEKDIAHIDFETLKAKHSDDVIDLSSDVLNELKKKVSTSFVEATIKKYLTDMATATTEEQKKALGDSLVDSVANHVKELSEARKKVCMSNGYKDTKYASEVWKMNNWSHFYDNKNFSSSDIVSNVGVSAIGYLVMYCLLFIAVGLGIFATIKDHKIMMITFSATVGVSALILFILNIVFMARSIAPRNNYSKAIEDLSQKERLGFNYLMRTVDWNQYEMFVKPDEKTLETTNNSVNKFQEIKRIAIETSAKEQKMNEEKWEKEQKDIDALTDAKIKEQKQAALDFEKKSDKHHSSEKYESNKKDWNAQTKTEGFMTFTLAFAEFSFFVISSVAGFMLFKC